jgi:hypothetical protein
MNLANPEVNFPQNDPDFSARMAFSHLQSEHTKHYPLQKNFCRDSGIKEVVDESDSRD